MATLADLVVQVGYALRDNVAGVTSNDSPIRNQAIDTDLGVGSAGRWKGSQILFISNLDSLTGDNPKQVRDFNSSSGILTLHDDWNSTNGVPANTQYVLMRLQGRGHPYETRVSALKYAYNKLNIYSIPAPYRGITTVAADYQYPLPSTIDTVFRVIVENSTGDRVDLGAPGRKWELNPGGQIEFNSKINVAAPYTIEIWGRKFETLPTSLTATIVGNPDEIVDLAVEFLLATSPRPENQAEKGGLMQERFRLHHEYSFPNERLILR
jgi:hypothetical protein